MKLHHLFALCLLALLIVACAGPEVKRGDYVLVTYTGTYTNGTIFDTNDPAMRDSFPAPAERFTSLPVQVGANSVVPGFENALLGMKEGEKKTVTIKATDAYGGWDPERTITVPKQVIFERELTMPRTVPTPRNEFEAQVGVATIGETFETENFLYNITDANSTHVTLYIVNATHDPVQLESLPWNSTFVRSDAANITFRHQVVAGENYTTVSGPYTAYLNRTHITLNTTFEVGQQYTTQQGIMRVARETMDSVTLDFNHPLAGQDLTFNITVNSIEERK